MRFLRRHAFWLLLLVLVAGLIGAPPTQTTARTRVADGFDQPVGKPDADGYYKSRGFRANYHMGEDWNGDGGGNSDLGKPVYAVAHGIVVMARDMRMSWGNLVIIRHIYVENGKLNTVDSVYAHMDRILVKEGQQIVRGQQVGTIGTAHGMYAAHLHFEIRKNLNIGYCQREFPRDLSSYYIPSLFIASHRKLEGAGRSALVPVDTFTMAGKVPVPMSPTDDSSPAHSPGHSPIVVQPTPPPVAKPSPGKSGPSHFRVNRFDDLMSF